VFLKQFRKDKTVGAKILIIENEEVTEFTKILLEAEDITVFLPLPGKDLVETVIANEIDVILMSMESPYSNGQELIIELQNMERTKDIPILILCGTFCMGDMKGTLECGAHDFIKKPVDPADLISRVHSACKFKNKIDTLKDSAERDSLTKLYNKRYFNNAIEEHISKINNYENGLALVMLDCDLFKRINDNYGHMAGDVVLAGVANAMSKSVKQNDVVCRFGGEEFCIILPDTTKEHAYEITERIRRNIARIDFKFKDDAVTITISSGISHMDRSNKKTASRLINESDTALYVAKNSGRDRTEVAWSV